MKKILFTFISFLLLTSLVFGSGISNPPSSGPGGTPGGSPGDTQCNIGGVLGACLHVVDTTYAPSSGIALTALATQATDTILANDTAGSASPEAVAIAAQQAVCRITGGHIKGCSVAEMQTLLGLGASGQHADAYFQIALTNPITLYSTYTAGHAAVFYGTNQIADGGAFVPWLTDYDAHATNASVTVAQVTNTVWHNIGQSNTISSQTLPATFSGETFTGLFYEASSAALRIIPHSGEKLILDGTECSANYVVTLATPAKGDSIAAKAGLSAAGVYSLWLVSGKTLWACIAP